MRIDIEELEFDTIIGILDFERETPQRVILNLYIEYEFLDSFINYADVSEFLKQDMQKNRYLLIEDALLAISKNLKKNFPLINTLYLKITKPSILPNCKVSVSDIYSF